MVSRQRFSAVRRAFACTLIACILLVGFTLACGIHVHSDTHCCDFCHFGFLPWIQAAGVPDIAPSLAREWRVNSDPGSQAPNNDRIARRGRAPPAC
jgi:hypothetical protein